MLIHTILKETNDFSDIEKIIAKYLLENEEEIEKQSARFIASQIYTAPSTIVRFCQKIGYEGFSDFKEAFIEEIKYLASHFNQINPNYPFSYNDKNITLANKMGQLYQEIISDTLSLLKHDTLQECINILKKAKIIHICSSGVQNDIAETFKDKLLKIGKNVIIEHKMDESFYRASFCEQDSVFIMISYSGETEILLRVAKKLQERKMYSIAITSYGDNALSSLAKQVLYVSTREKITYNLGNFGMSISTLFLLDILYASIFNDNYQTHFEKRVKSSKEFQVVRSSLNPILKDQEEK